MATDNPFSLDQAAETDPDAPRRKKLAAFGLGGLIKPASPETSQLEDQPLYGGDISKTAAETAEEPSQLSTERVERAPISQEATYLLNPEDRLGNALTGEATQNTYQPLSQEERSSRVKQFLNDNSESSPVDSANTIRNVGGAANTAINYSKLANQAGTRIGRSLADLAAAGGSASGRSLADFSQYFSLGGQPTEGFPINPAGLNFTDEGAKVLDTAKYNLGGATGAENAGSIAPYIGAVGAGVSGALSLATLINSIVSGQNDTSKTGSIPKAGQSLALSSLPILEALIPGLTGISGLGLAMTPMLIPAIMDIVKMFGDPNLPYNSGNMSQYRSRAAAAEIPGQLNQYLLGQNDPMSLIALATGAMPFSPNSEILLRAGGNYSGSDPYNDLLERVLNRDPQAIQDYLRSVEFTSGETGGVHNVESQLTDTFRRQLAHSLGLTPDQTEGMFGTDTYKSVYDRYASEIPANSEVGNIGPGDLAGWQASLNRAGADDYSDFGGYSPYYRDPSAGRLSTGQVASLMDLLGSGNPSAYYAKNPNDLLPMDNSTLDPYLQSLRAYAMANRAGDGGGEGGGL